MLLRSCCSACDELSECCCRAGGKLVIVNLQATPKDRKAQLVIRGRVDQVMRAVLAGLDMQIPAYIRDDSVVVAHCQEAPGSRGVPFSLAVHSAHGTGCPMPLMESVEISFQVSYIPTACIPAPAAAIGRASRGLTSKWCML
jgi:hypothetical protein